MRPKTFSKGKSLLFIIYFYLSEEHGLLPEQFNKILFKNVYLLFFFLKQYVELKSENMGVYCH